MSGSQYTGLFVHKLSDGSITDVQVEDSHGIGLSLPISDYERRGILPPVETLPDQNSYGKVN